MRWGQERGVLRALTAFAASAVLVVGIPVLLLVVVGNPFPSSVPTIDEIRVTLTQNGDGFGRFVVSALAVVVWFIWVQICIAFVVEIPVSYTHLTLPTICSV